VAEEIRVLLARRKMSANQLAQVTGIKQSSLSRRMTGETAFDMDDLELIADALGVVVTDLMPQRVSTGNETNRVFTPVSRLQAPEPPAQPRRSARRPSGRTSREDRRPRQVRTPGHTMSSACAA
jgi:transcriptional regulator with XRE-family HTH domain